MDTVQYTFMTICHSILFFLECEKFRIKLLTKIKTNISCSTTLSEICAIYETG